MLIVKANCPHCGAPLSLAEGQGHVICAYCDVSLLVDRSRPGAAAPGQLPALAAEAVPPEEIRRIKQLIFEGKRAQAIDHYANIARVERAEADVAVTQLFVPELLALYRHMPINLVGFSIASLLIFGSAGVATLGVLRGGEDGGWILIGVVGALLCVLLVRWLIPKVASALVCSFGARGQARVIKRNVVHTFKEGHAAALVLFEVHPAAGGPSFFDEEPMLVRAESLQKLSPGNVVWVRYDEPRRRRVFPESPIQVISSAVQ